MTRPQFASRWIALSGLFVLFTVILLPTPSTWTFIVAAPLIVMFVLGLKPSRRWGGWVAVFMIPYLCVAIGELIADPDDRPTDMVIVGCTLIVFFAAMDYVRKTGTSLRR